MSYIDEINGLTYLYLLELSEPEDNVLRLVVAEGHAAGDERATENFKALGPLASTSMPIVVTERSARYEITFASYVAYSVVNESFTVANGTEQFNGSTFRVYFKSAFLDYVSAATIASDDYGGPYTHYGIICLNHIIEVASAAAPQIVRLRASSVRRSLRSMSSSSSSALPTST